MDNPRQAEKLAACNVFGTHKAKSPALSEGFHRVVSVLKLRATRLQASIT